MTFCGLKSRWVTPYAWTLASPSASAANSRRQVSAGRAPPCATAWESVGPATYSVASQNGCAASEASIRFAVYAERTARTVSASRRNRASASGWPVISSRITFTATRRPPGERARYTCPIPPAPSRANRACAPMRAGSVSLRGSIRTSLPHRFPCPTGGLTRNAARRTGSARSARPAPSRRAAPRPQDRSRPRPRSYGPARTPTRPPGGGADAPSGRC